MRTTASASQRIVSNTVTPPNVIDSPSFPVLPRLFVLSIASEGLYLLLARHEPALSLEFLLLWSALFIAYAFAVREARASSGDFLFIFILVVSALFRVSLLRVGSGSSTDAPHAFLHAATPIGEAIGLRPDLRRMATVVFDLLTLALLPPLLRSLSLPTGLALVYGWNPLLVTETAAGRLETIPLFFLLLAFRLLREKHLTASALAYGASLAGPPFFWATLPVAAGVLGKRLALSLLVGAVGWVPLAATMPWPDLMGWPPATSVGGSLMPAAAALARLFVTREPLAVYALCAVIWFVVALARAMKLERCRASAPLEALVLLGLFLFLSPEVLPWAFLPIAGLAAFSANPGWIVATATAPLTYLALREGSWSFWLAFAQYFPVYASLVFVSLGTKRGRKGRPGKAK
jgi:hypothetical protein